MSRKAHRKVVEGSIPYRVAQLPVGGCLWVETTREQYANVLRAYGLPLSRRAPETKNFRIRCSVYQALPVGKIAEEVTVLVRVERVA